MGTESADAQAHSNEGASGGPKDTRACYLGERSGVPETNVGDVSFI